MVSFRNFKEKFFSVIEHRSTKQMLYIRQVFLVDNVKMNIWILFGNIQYLLDMKFTFLRRHVVDDIGEDNLSVFHIF